MLSRKVERALDYTFDESGRTLIVVGDINKGWHNTDIDSKPRKTYCFSEVVHVEWQGGTILAQISVFPRPGGLTDAWAIPPTLNLASLRHSRYQSPTMWIDAGTGDFIGFGREDDCCTVTAAEGKLRASIELLDESGRRPGGMVLRPNKAGLQFLDRVHDVTVPSDTDLWWQLNIQLRLTFTPPKKPAPIERSFWNEFLPGGRPESNRRRF